jgi:hypothetical protein
MTHVSRKKYDKKHGIFVEFCHDERAVEKGRRDHGQRIEATAPTGLVSHKAVDSLADAPCLSLDRWFLMRLDNFAVVVARLCVCVDLIDSLHGRDIGQNGHDP